MAETGFDLLQMLFPQFPQQGAEQALQAPEQAPAVQALAAPQAAGGWGQYLSDPANRAFMISAGLQMATGGWGNTGQQIAAALGKGAEAASGTQQVAFEQAEKEKEVQRRSSEAAAGRKTQMDIAKLGASSREDIARARIEGMLARTTMNLQAKENNPQLWLKHLTEARKTVEGNLANLSLGEEEREAMIEALARKRFEADPAGVSGRSPKASSGGGASSGGASSGSTEITPAKKKKAKAEAEAEAEAKIEALWNKIQAHPKFAATMSTAAGRQELKEAHPKIAYKIRDIETSQQIDWLKRVFGLGEQSTPGTPAQPAPLTIPQGVP